MWCPLCRRLDEPLSMSGHEDEHKNLCFCKKLNPSHSNRSESLYRLSYKSLCHICSYINCSY
jgi:hypothetical protein